VGTENSELKKSGLTYSDSGVDIDRGNAAKDRIKELARSTFGPAVLSEIGSFAGLYRIDLQKMQSPVLVSSADGVGTKLKIAFLTGVHDTVGIDLVSHCTNDILAQRAFPAFFLDYIGAGRLDEGIVEQIVSGLAEGCRRSGCALLGGETAEMPDFYDEGEYDLVGFIVGIADEAKILDWGQVHKGDLLLGLPSSGLHTNGYSLVRKVLLEIEELPLDTHIELLGRTLGEELLEPHRNYVPVVKKLIENDAVRAMAHITGGGITDNLARVLPPELDAQVSRGSWNPLPIFQLVAEKGRIATEEMYRTFNMGLGMILVISPDRAEYVERDLLARGEQFHWVGEVAEGNGRVLYP